MKHWTMRTRVIIFAYVMFLFSLTYYLSGFAVKRCPGVAATFIMAIICGHWFSDPDDTIPTGRKSNS